ncbi:MAG: hypothetical protein ACR2PR_07525 [Pseudohongiellaceae bacterium]
MPVQQFGNMFQQFDYGKAVQDGQNIQYNQLRNQALGDEQEQRRNMLKNRQKAQQIRELYNSMPDQISALESEGLFDQADELRNDYIKFRKNETTLLEGMRPNINAGNYKSLRQDLIQAGAVTPDMMPTEYSDEWFRKQIDEKKGALSKFTIDSFRNGANMSRDLVQQDGSINWELSGEWYENPSKNKKPGDGKGGSGGSFSFKAADTNAIRNQATQLFGGFYDPATGKISGLDPDKVNKVAALQAEAEKIYQENQGAVTHGVAIARAARKLKINVQNVRDSAATDPAGIL